LVSLSFMIGKNCFVASPFVVLSHWFCHLAVLCALSCCTIYNISSNGRYAGIRNTIHMCALRGAGNHF
jgi:hypothetical protein